ncbi:hypothetical protein K1719_041547 [Acacia pycnantha]|nr:hypothetical protein K1719_041547 [Acacia pycnantha]
MSIWAEHFVILGASINLMPLSVSKALGIKEMKPTMMSLRLADRPFLATARAVIDVAAGKMEFQMNDEKVTYNVFQSMKYPADNSDCFKIDVVDEAIQEVEELKKKDYDAPPVTPKVELKELPSNLKYVFLGKDDTYPIIVSTELSPTDEEKLLKVLTTCKTTIGRLNDATRKDHFHLPFKKKIKRWHDRRILPKAFHPGQQRLKPYHGGDIDRGGTSVATGS